MAALIPLGVLLADYVENGPVIAMLLNTPRPLESAARAATFFTVLNFLLSWLELIVFIGSVGWLLQAIRARTATSSHAGD